MHEKLKKMGEDELYFRKMDREEPERYEEMQKEKYGENEYRVEIRKSIEEREEWKGYNKIHLEKEEKERGRRALEGYFKKQYEEIDPELYKELRFVHTKIVNSNDEKHESKTEHYFHDGNYGPREIRMKNASCDLI